MRCQRWSFKVQPGSTIAVVVVSCVLSALGDIP